VIERHRPLWDLYCSLLTGRTDAEIAADCDREIKVRIELLTVQPTTLAGCAALIRYVNGVANSTDESDGLFCEWYEPISGPAAVFLDRMADMIERTAAQS
jgi:hypothetical protein